MSAIHYKFSSSNDYKNVTFDGLSISVQDCKKAIMEKEKLKLTEVDLLLTNAQSLKDYKDESDLIAKNSALLVRRVPIGGTQGSDKSKVYIVKRNQSAASKNSGSNYLTLDQLKKTEDLVAANASEQDKIKAMMDQSTTEYDPSKYIKPPKSGTYPRYDSSHGHTAFVKCYKCNQTGHYATQCRLNKVAERSKAIRPATGIPRSHMVQVNKDAKGAMLTPDGQYVVPFIDKKGYEVGKKEKPPFLPDLGVDNDDEEDEPVPDELICLLCKEIMEDAVVIPCCGNSYCDECVRNALLESDDHECPTCHKKNISPDSLIANKFLRQAVNKFRNENGISRKKSKNAPVWPRPAAVDRKPTQPPPKPIKVEYGPPKPCLTTSLSNNGEYVVKAKSAQIYAAAGYTIRKASNLALPTAKVVVSTPTVTHAVNLEPESPATSVVSASSSDSLLVSERSVADTDSMPSNKAEPMISPLNMMVERPDSESPPPPPPLPLSMGNFETGDDAITNEPEMERIECEQPEEEVESTVEDSRLDDESAPSSSAQITALPSLLDDSPSHHVNTFPIQPQGISITLKNATPVHTSANAPTATIQPPVQIQSNAVQGQPSLPIVDPPMHVLMPAQKVANQLSILGSVPSSSPLIQHPPPSISLPRLGILPPAMPLPGGRPPRHSVQVGLPPPLIRGGIRPSALPTSMPPPSILRPPAPGIGLPPPLGSLPRGALPPRLPFLPPPGVPPPGFINQPPATQDLDTQSNNAPPPPGTGTPPTVVPQVKNERSSTHDRGSPRSKRENHNKGDKSPLKSRKSKLAIMSDEFTREQTEKVQARRNKHRGRGGSKLGSDSFSSSSYSSSSSLSSSRSTYSSSGSSSYSTSRSSSSSRSQSATPVHSQRRLTGKRGKKSYSRSSSRSISYSPHRRRGKKWISKRHRVPPSSSRSKRRRSRSVDKEIGRRKRYRRSHSRERRKRYSKDGVIIPGMPPQSVLDYERDLALYDYYKQKYEQDWLRCRISPPSPFKRFISYDPTKIPPPTSHQPSHLGRGLSQYPSRIAVQANQPQMTTFSQPPPPGDATPTEEDAGLYAFRAHSPEPYFRQPGQFPWDPPHYDGDLGERARMLQEEEYYNNMQNSLHNSADWAQDRSAGGRYSAQGKISSRGRRLVDARRRKTRSPTSDRARNWDEDAARYSSRSRRLDYEKSAGHKDLVDRERDSRSRKKIDGFKESRPSRREEDMSRGSWKRAHYQCESQSRRKGRSSRRNESPEQSQSDEPYPPGEGDGTPVRDESRVKFSNEGIKVKVINDKVKGRKDGRQEKSSNIHSKNPTSRKGEESVSSGRRLDGEPGQRIVKRAENTSKASVKKYHSKSSPAFKQSQTPTLDENGSPTRFATELPDDDSSHSVSTDFPRSESKRIKSAEILHTERDRDEENADNQTSLRKLRSQKVTMKAREVAKAKQSLKLRPPGNRHPQQKYKDHDLAIQESTSVSIHKSKWDSDGEKSPPGPSEKPTKAKPNSAKISEKTFGSKLIKPRKIKIKKPGGHASTADLEKKAKSVGKNKPVEGSTENFSKSYSPNINLGNPSVAIPKDSRRVVVSCTGESTVDETAQNIHLQEARTLRPSVSNIDEATFEPDYNDNESEKALSNYAPSDIDNEEQMNLLGGKGSEEIAKNTIREMKLEEANILSNKGDIEASKRHDKQAVMANEGCMESEEPVEKNKKRKKKKKRKHKKHKQQLGKELDFEEVTESGCEEEYRSLKHNKQTSSSKRSPYHSKSYSTEIDSGDYNKSTRDSKRSEKGRKDYRCVHEAGEIRKRSLQQEKFGKEQGEECERKSKKKSRRSPREKRRKVVMHDQDELSLDDEFYSLDDYRSPSPEERRRYKKKQKHKRYSNESSKEVKTVASKFKI